MASDQQSADLLYSALLRPNATNAFESTVEQLAATIRLGVFRDGELLPPERELAERLAVSRTTVREAMAALRSAGLVTTRRGRGGGSEVTYTAQPLPTSLGEQVKLVNAYDDMLDYRRVVEPGAARLAAGRDLDPAERVLLGDALTTAEEATNTPDRRLADCRLHLAIATASGSPLLVESVTKVQTALDDLLRRIPVLPTNIEHSNDQHRALVQAILAGRENRARDLMEEHVDGTAALLRGLIG